MVLDLTPGEIFDELGHDGSQILWPNQEEPFNRRSFHPQELIPLAIARCYYPVEIEHQPTIGMEDEDFVEVFQNEFLAEALVTRPGVIMCLHKGCRHVVAWNSDEQKVYDPAGFKADISEYEVLAFYAFY